LRDGAILIVGAGGLGVPTACALARAGVGRLGLVDPDPVELSNLARQVIYRSADIGVPKVDAAAHHLRKLLPRLELRTHHCRLDESNAAALIAEYDFIVDATDNPAAKFLINDRCVGALRPFVYGGVLGLNGQAMTVLPGETACLRCLFEEPPGEAEGLRCHEAGILGPIAGAIGQVEAREVISFLSGRRPQLAGRMLIYDGAAGRVRLAPAPARRGCGCGAWREAAPAAARN